MKVLFVGSGNHAKVSPIIKAQGDSLVKAGADVDYFLVKGKGIKGYLNQVGPLRRYCKEHHFDVVHAHYSLSAYVASLAGVRPLVVSLMGSDVKATGWHGRAVRLFSKLFRWKDIIVKSKDMAEAVRITDAHIIPNGVDMDLFVPKSQQECRQTLGWKEGGQHILFPADPNRPEKDFALAQEAVKLLNKEVTIHVFQQVEHKETVLHYNAADVVLLTSKWEGSPNAVKEALACNRPIVCTNVGDVKERLSGVEGCFVVESRNPKDLADAIDLALEYKECLGGRDALKAAGLGSRQIADKIITIYKQIQ